jgi:hypothetical protein
MRKKSLKNALKFIPDAPYARSENISKSQRKYKKRVWKSLSWLEKERLVRVGNKIIAASLAKSAA